MFSGNGSGNSAKGSYQRREFLGICAAGLAGRHVYRQDSGSDRLIPRGPTVELREIIDGLGLPTAMTATDEFLYITQRTGQIARFDGELNPFLDISDQVVTGASWEQGLLGMELHPDFERNRRFYLRYSAPWADPPPKFEGYSHQFVLSEFRAAESFKRGIPGSERRILTIPQPGPSHNAGGIEFGPDGNLYVAVGDGGFSEGKNWGDTGPGHVEDWYENVPGGNGQDVTENLLGSILRIDVDASSNGKPYSIPDDNPLVGAEGLDEHYAWGLRNPYKMSFYGSDLITGDAGANNWEEINVIRKGSNYGWNVKEGSRCFQYRDDITGCPDRTPPSVRGGEKLVDPVLEYPRIKDGTIIGLVVIGGHVYVGDRIGALREKYVFGDNYNPELETGRIFLSTPRQDEASWEMEEIMVSNSEDDRLGEAVTAFGTDTRDRSYVLTSPVDDDETGKVFRFEPQA